MKAQSSLLRTGAVCAAGAAMILIGMVIVGSGAGEAVGFLGQPGTPEQYAVVMRPVAVALLRAMALDNVFLILYMGAFISAARLIWAQARGFAGVGLGFVVLLALLDVAENAVTVDMARAVIREMPIPAWEISALGLLEQVKYASGAMAVVLFALGLWIALPHSWYAKGVAGLFLCFPVMNALKIVGISEGGLIVWMLVMLVGSAGLLWREGLRR